AASLPTGEGLCLHQPSPSALPPPLPGGRGLISDDLLPGGRSFLMCEASAQPYTFPGGGRWLGGMQT
ncbi:MAG: hypothetical protein IJN17_01480, partial [Clostridia bacterium]|nr:hypothetical protein [Clostridia bacterium]